RRPVLTVTEGFKPPERVMIAFDGSGVTRRGVEMIAASPLFAGLPIHLLMSGKPRADAPRQLDWAHARLETAGFAVTPAWVPGDAETVIARVVQEQSIDLLVMGAFGHSVLRRLILGSKTADLLRSATIPTLLLR
ncbi:MAG TPA: universal stress protein, partial [Gammaproteobacteria bacterium]|nr:universal stress protein [Gammaproteobacteria bacterium]